MKKRIFALAWCLVLFLPCLMIFSEGGFSLLGFMGIDDGPYLVNLIGMLYSAFLLRFHRLVVPGWVRDTVEEMVRDE